MRIVVALVLLCFVLLPDHSVAQEDRTTLIAANDELRLVRLLPMRNGLSALTLAWPLKGQTADNAAAIEAGLLSVVSGGTDSRTPWDIETYLGLKGIRQRTSIYRDNLLLTITAPDDVFLETLEHLKNVLLDAEYSDAWYARERHALRRPLSSKRRRASDVLFRVEAFLAHAFSETDAPALGPRFRFGRPSHAILRAQDDKVDKRTQRLLAQLPAAEPPPPFSNWFGWFKKRDGDRFTLPNGVIHFSDPASTETLVLLVSAKEFDHEDHQAGANLLMDYIGSGIGSEMFRIIRQELRASYDPEARFILFGQRRGLLTMSATVEATEWPDIYEEMRKIYQTVRQGRLDREGLEIQHDWLQLSFRDKFHRNATWTAERVIDAYPKTVIGDVRVPLFSSVEDLNLEATILHAETILPPFDDYLVVIIGGGDNPSLALPDRPYCSLKSLEPIDHCIQRLLRAKD